MLRLAPWYFSTSSFIASKIIVASNIIGKSISQSLFDILFFSLFSAQNHFHNRNNSKRPLWAKNVSQLARDDMTSSLMRICEKWKIFQYYAQERVRGEGSAWMLRLEVALRWKSLKLLLLITSTWLLMLINKALLTICKLYSDWKIMRWK